MLTERDSQIVGWIGRLGAAGAEHVMARFGMNYTAAYVRLAWLVKSGLLEHRRVLYGRAGMYVATRAGLNLRGYGGLGVVRVAPGRFEHAWQTAAAAVALEHGLPGWRLLSDREVLWYERQERELLASMRPGSGEGGGRSMHRPDLVLLSPHGRVAAVEVELSVKARSRLIAICRGWARARHVDAVYYLASPAAAHAVGRAVGETRAADRITILPLDQADKLVERELENAHVGGDGRWTVIDQTIERDGRGRWTVIGETIKRDRGEARPRPVAH